MTFTIFFVTTSYQSLKLVTLTYNEVTVTNLRIHYTVVIEKLVNVTKQCSDVHFIVFTVHNWATEEAITPQLGLQTHNTLPRTVITCKTLYNS